MNNTMPAEEKTVLLMGLLAKRSEGASQAELKKELGISMSTAYWILQTLLEDKWVKKNSRRLYTPDNGLLFSWTAPSCRITVIGRITSRYLPRT